MKKNNIILYITIFIGIILSLFISLRLQTNSWNLNNIKDLNIFFFLIIVYFFLIGVLLILKKDFIYKKRFLLIFILLILLVLGKLHGSSINLWDNIIEPSNSFQKDSYLGVGRSIRSDEWVVNTPYSISQQYNDYKITSNLPRSEKTDMFTPIFVPIKDILALTRPFNIGYLLFGEEYGLSFYWYGRLLCLIIVSFEFFMLLTNKKKLPSLIGTFLLVGSPLVQWFYSNYIVDLLISGELSIILLSLFLKSNDKKKKILLSIFLGLSLSWYIFTLYPAWQISLGYIFLLIGINELRKQKFNIKKEYLYFLIPISIITLFIGRFIYIGKDTLNIIMNTVYPGKRNITGGGTILEHFLYPITILFPFKNYGNPSEASGVFSLFPLPMIYSLIYIFKNRKDSDKFLINGLLIVGIIYLLFCLIPLPNILTKITLLYLVPTGRIYPIIGIISLYLMILTLGKIQINKKLQLPIIIISILLGIIIPYLGNEINKSYLTNKSFILISLLLILIIYFYINSSNKKINIILTLFLIGLSSINIIMINPVNKGTKVLHEKECAKEIRKINKRDNGTWIALNSIELPNYVLANGSKVINSTNIYPNLKLWKKLDKNKEYIDIYNRYAHIEIIITKEKTYFELVQPDYFKVFINEKDFDKIDFKYVITREEIDNFKKLNLKEIYRNDNILIYKIIREKSL